jgi:hypothetical protein
MRGPSTRTNSCGTTVSSPAGMVAPVMMRTHCRGRSRPTTSPPAKPLPTTSSTVSRRRRQVGGAKA